MRDFDFNTLTSADLVNHSKLSNAFKFYLIEILGYDEFEADLIISSDFEDPYSAQFVIQEYHDIITVDNKDYEVRYCYTDFCMCGLFHLASLPSFEFYMFIDKETLEDQTVGSYMAAQKLYLI